jgi:hypothetical protein
MAAKAASSTANQIAKVFSACGTPLTITFVTK